MTTGDRDATPFLELPFEVTAGTEALHVRYRHDPGSILDLGLLDPDAGPFPSERGLRGWSGGARDQVAVARSWATPGYLPGPIAAGTWRVLLGLAAVAEGSCGFWVEVTGHAHEDEVPLRAEAARAAAADAPAAAAAAGAPASALDPEVAPQGWYRGDLQSHTHHSDARGSLGDLRAAALARGLEVLAVTDHNTVSHHAPIRSFPPVPLLLVPGTEITTHHGHANVWGDLGPIDFRVRGAADVDVLVDHVHARGGVVSINHPKHTPGCIGCDWEYHVPAGIDCLEAWQGPWAFRNWQSLERYDALLRAGRRVTLVGGSDRHQGAGPDSVPEMLRVGSPTTFLHLEDRSAPGVLAALRGGRATVADGPAGPFLSIEVGGRVMGGDVAPEPHHLARAHVHGGDGELLRWIGPAGVVREVVIEGDRFEDTFTLDRIAHVPAAGGFLRAEVVARGGLGPRLEAVRAYAAASGLPYGITIAEVAAQPYRLALSNPVYLRAAGTPTA